MRIYGRTAAARYYFVIDGQECAKPSKIDIGMYEGAAPNMHIPAVLRGVCEATSRGRLRKGWHIVQVMVGRLPRHNNGDAESKWHTTAILEVEEICPQF